MNYQDIYDRVKDHLLTQSKRAAVYSGYGKVECKYRTDDGLKCAIGALIPDDSYIPEMEGRSAPSVFQNWPDVGREIEYDDHHLPDASFLLDLQRVHDKFYPRHWKEELRRLARKYNLRP